MLMGMTFDLLQWDLGFKVVTAACCMETWCVVMALTDIYTDQVCPALLRSISRCALFTCYVASRLPFTTNLLAKAFASTGLGASWHALHAVATTVRVVCTRLSALVCCATHVL